MKPNLKTPLVVFAQDPGSKNYAISIVRGAVVRNKLKVKVLTNFMLTDLITQLKDVEAFTLESSKYKKAITEILKTHKPAAVVFERFMTRGIKGATIEYVSSMLGLLRGLTQLDVHAIPAVTWKSAVKRWGLDLDGMYKETRTTAHQVDATVMAIWLLAKCFGLPEVKINKPKLLKAIERTSKTDLKRKKK